MDHSTPSRLLGALIASLLLLPLLIVWTACTQRGKTTLLIHKIWLAGYKSRAHREARAGKEERGEWLSSNYVQVQLVN
jgi:hypothetical protein